MGYEIVIRPSRGWHLGLGEVWAYRELLFSLIQRNIKVRYKQTVIGVAWVLFQPLLTMVVFSFLFGRLIKVPSDGAPYSLFALSGIILWNYFAGAVSGAANSLVEHQNLLSKVYFPRLILPLVAVGTGAVDFGIVLIVAVGIMFFTGVTPSVTIIWAPVFFLLAALTSLSVGLWLAALNALYRDVRYVLPFFIQLWMFASPVVYPASLLPERWQWLYAINPMAGIIEGFRWSLLGQNPPSFPLAVSLLVMIGAFVGGVLYFRRVERTIVDRI